MRFKTYTFLYFTESCIFQNTLTTSYLHECILDVYILTRAGVVGASEPFSSHLRSYMNCLKFVARGQF